MKNPLRRTRQAPSLCIRAETKIIKMKITILQALHLLKQCRSPQHVQHSLKSALKQDR